MQVTKVFKFGLLPPTKNGEMVAEQMRNGHAYQNQLVRIENDRREAIRGVGAQLSLGIARLEAELDEIKSELKNTYGVVGSKHSAQMDKWTSKEDKAIVDSLKSRKKAIIAQLKPLRAELKADPVAQEMFAAAEAESKQKRSARIKSSSTL